MAAHCVNSNEDTEISECDGEKVVTMMDVLQEQQDFEDDVNAVLGASDDKNCTYLKGSVKRQAIYACLTCCPESKHDESKRAGVCLACSLNCHENHELVELYTKRNFRCDCGNPKFNSHPCQFTTNKTDLNDTNYYNQNFAGIYCVCHRPYPDPDALEEDEMIQCIICEDWLHSAHLDSVVPPADQYAEMVCKDCMKKNEFLQDYSDIAVITDNLDVDIVSTNPEPSIVSVTTITNDDKELFTDDKDLKQNGEATDVERGNDSLELLDGKDKQNVSTSDVAMSNDNSELSDEKVLRDIEEVLENKSSEEPIIPQITENSETPTNNVTLKLDNEESMKESKENTELQSKDSLRHDERNLVDKVINNISDHADQVQGNEETPEDNECNENLTNVMLNDNSNLSDNYSRENQQNNETVSIINNNEQIQKENGVDQITEPGVMEDCPNKIYIESSEDKITEFNNTDLETSIKQNKMSEISDIGTEGNSELAEKDKIDDIETSETNAKIEQIDGGETSKPNIENSEQLLNECNDNMPKEPKALTDENVPHGFDNTTEAEKESSNETIPLAESDKSMNEETNSPDHLSVNKEETTSSINNCFIQNESTNNETIKVTESDRALERENLTEHLSINQVETSSSIDDCAIQNGSTHCGDGGNDLKRKYDDEIESEAKKPKLHNLSRGEGCTRPIKNKKTLKGSTFWPANFRQKLCTCNECILMYKDLAVLFLTDPEDTVTAYETLGQEKTPSSQYERGLEALSSLDRVQQINALTEYNNMRDKLLDFLKSFKDRKEIVKEDDIKAFFAGMKPKREPDGVYFCR